MTRRHGRTTCLFVLAVAVALALAAPSGASAANKPYTVTISPSHTARGKNVSITATFKNLTGPPGGQKIGSANLFWPTSVFSNWSVTPPNVTVSVPSPGIATLGICTFGTQTGPCIQLRNLSVAPSKSLTVTITPNVPTPTCSAPTGTWSVETKQSNDFSGPPGNDLTLSSSSELTSTLDGACPRPSNPKPPSAQPPSPVEEQQPYGLAVSPSLISAGQRVTVTASLSLPSVDTNRAAQDDQQLGSANLFLPTAVFPGGPTADPTSGIPAVRLSTPGTWSLSKSCTFGTLTGPCVQLRNLAVKPGHALAVTITASAPACSTAAGTWRVEARPSSDFNGPPGSDLILAPGSQSTSTLDGACSLAWNAQPAASLTFDPATVPLHFVTSVPFTRGRPISVNVLDSRGRPAKGAIDAQLDGPTVTLTAQRNPGAATLGGTSAAASGGIASFGALTINRAGDGYRLSASSGSLARGVSHAFIVVDKATSCRVKARSCSTTARNGSGRGRILAKATKRTGIGELTLSVNSNNSNTLRCGRYVSADRNVYEFAGPAQRTKVGIITITRPNRNSATLTGTAKQILRAQQICFDGPVRFMTASRVRAARDGHGGFIGLLPTCTSDVPDRDHDRNDGDHDGDDRRVTTGPCHNRQQDKITSDLLSPLHFDIVLVADIPAGTGDPHMR